MKEYGIDAMKYRKSTHLAGCDVDTMVAEKGKCILTIKEAYYSQAEIVNGKKKGEVVNGKVVDGYFLNFEEDVKTMMVNSVNRKSIIKIVKTLKNCTSVESRNIANWVGVQIELYFDENVKFGDEVTGGFRVKPFPVVKEKKPMQDDKLTDAINAVKDGKYTLEQIKKSYTLTPEQEKQFKL